jgi:hypothetical protein
VQREASRRLAAPSRRTARCSSEARPLPIALAWHLSELRPSRVLLWPPVRRSGRGGLLEKKPCVLTKQPRVGLARRVRRARGMGFVGTRGEAAFASPRPRMRAAPLCFSDSAALRTGHPRRADAQTSSRNAVSLEQAPGRLLHLLRQRDDRGSSSASLRVQPALQCQICTLRRCGETSSLAAQRRRVAQPRPAGEGAAALRQRSSRQLSRAPPPRALPSAGMSSPPRRAHHRGEGQRLPLLHDDSSTLLSFRPPRALPPPSRRRSFPPTLSLPRSQSPAARARVQHFLTPLPRHERSGFASVRLLSPTARAALAHSFA